MTAINTGTLKLAAATGNSIASSPTITVKSGAILDVTGLNGGAITLAGGQTLAGGGTVAGGVVASPYSIVAPGMDTLAVGSLNMASGSVYDYQFSSTAAHGMVSVNTTGGLTINGGGFNLYNQGTTTPFAGPGTYRVLQYSGALGGFGTSALSVLNQLPGTSYKFSSSPNEVDVTIQPNPASRDPGTCPVPPNLNSTDQLAVWSNGSWQPVTPGSISGKVHILVHGWAKGEWSWVDSNGDSSARAWNAIDPNSGKNWFQPFTDLAGAISADTCGKDTILAYSWIYQSATINSDAAAVLSAAKATSAGLTLSNQLQAAFGTNSVDLQFIGHSHGAKVATVAAEQLEKSPADHVDQLTLLDSPEATPFGIAANSLGVELGKLAAVAGPKTVFVDNYVSCFGSAYSSTGSVNVVNVNLDPFPTDLTNAHGYPIGWYANSASQSTPHAYNVGIDWSPLVNSTSCPGSLQWSQQWKDVLGGPDYSKELNLVPGTSPPPLPMTLARAVSDLTTLGTTYGVTGIPGGFDFVKHSPQYLDSTFTTSSTDIALQFNYQFIQPGQGDQLAVWIDNELRFSVMGELVGTEAQVGYFDISDLAPGIHVMTFALEDFGSAPAEFTVTNLEVVSIPEPSTLALLAAGLFGLLTYAWRRRRQPV